VSRKTAFQSRAGSRPRRAAGPRRAGWLAARGIRQACPPHSELQPPPCTCGKPVFRAVMEPLRRRRSPSLGAQPRAGPGPGLHAAPCRVAVDGARRSALDPPSTRPAYVAPQALAARLSSRCRARQGVFAPPQPGAAAKQ
jgi:hypothetical protein